MYSKSDAAIKGILKVRKNIPWGKTKEFYTEVSNIFKEKYKSDLSPRTIASVLSLRHPHFSKRVFDICVNVARKYKEAEEQEISKQTIEL